MAPREPLVPPGRPLACCVEVPEAFREKARYAVEELLRGLALAPRWTTPEGLIDGGLYYGTRPEGAPPSALVFRAAPETVAFFAAPRPLDPVSVGRLFWDGEAWPLPFDGGGGPDEKDVFAAAFFWLSGWDEVGTPVRDRHGRFPFEASLLGRLAPALPPLVDVYRAWLGERLAERGVDVPGRAWGGKRWAVALTVDVDVVRTRRLGRLARGLAAGRVGEAARALAPGDARWEALAAFKGTAEARGARATWFLKAGAHAPEDVPYRLEARRLRDFLARLRADGHEVGLHPSYAAYDHAGRLLAERDRLADVLGEAPRVVRTHFLRWAEPATPRLLAHSGFLLDSSLGFAARPGFRRAAATPFRLYDRHADRPLGLWELPLAVMDTTLFEHLQLTAEAAEAAAIGVCDAARRVGGCAVLLWHNSPSVRREAVWRLHVLKRVLGHAAAEGAAVSSLAAAADAWHPGSGGGT